MLIWKSLDVRLALPAEIRHVPTSNPNKISDRSCGVREAQEFRILYVSFLTLADSFLHGRFIEILGYIFGWAVQLK